MYTSSGFDTMSSFFPIIFLCLLAIVITTFIVVAVKGISQWSKNNTQPVLVVPAKLISKRTDVSSGMHNDAGSGSFSHTHTSYYLTFEVETGSIMEFLVNGNEYGLLAEGYSGKLRFQGTRYLGFERII